LAGTGIRRNPEEFGGIRSKCRNSCPTGIPAKNPVTVAKNRNSCDPPPKPHYCDEIPLENTGKKEIFRNPVFSDFEPPK
jgi:hypothetical protein